jgi:hypothetical protein
VSVHWFLRESRCDRCPKLATADERRKTQILISHFSDFICGFFCGGIRSNSRSRKFHNSPQRSLGGIFLKLSHLDILVI